MKLFLLLPAISALLLYFSLRSGRQNKFLQQRLQELTPRSDVEQSLRLSQKTTVVPQGLGERLDALFATTGNCIGIVHSLLAALIASVIMLAFTSRILGLDPWLVWVSMVIAAGGTPMLLLKFAQGRYRRKFLDVFPDALDLVRRGVRAGLPVIDALHDASRETPDPVGHELRRTFAQVQLGIPMIDALVSTADRIGIADFRFLVVALALQQKTGGSLAETLGNLSSVIRARKSLRLKVRGLTAEAKVSAAVLAALPFLVAGAMYILAHDLSTILFTDPRGLFMVGIAFLSLTTGLSLMHIIVRRAVQ